MTLTEAVAVANAKADAAEQEQKQLAEGFYHLTRETIGPETRRLAAKYLSRLATGDQSTNERKADAYGLLSTFDTKGGEADLFELFSHVLMGRGVEARRILLAHAEQQALAVHAEEAELAREDALLEDSQGRMYTLHR